MKTKRQTENTRFVQGVGRALRRAAKAARKTAKMYGTPIYVWENGKVVAKKPSFFRMVIDHTGPILRNVSDDPKLYGL